MKLFFMYFSPVPCYRAQRHILERVQAVTSLMRQADFTPLPNVRMLGAVPSLLLTPAFRDDYVSIVTPALRLPTIQHQNFTHTHVYQ
jgi:hypothetical protein